jgi:hypothetical protein
MSAKPLAAGYGGIGRRYRRWLPSRRIEHISRDNCCAIVINPSIVIIVLRIETFFRILFIAPAVSVIKKRQGFWRSGELINHIQE